MHYVSMTVVCASNEWCDSGISSRRCLPKNAMFLPGHFSLHFRCKRHPLCCKTGCSTVGFPYKLSMRPEFVSSQPSSNGSFPMITTRPDCPKTIRERNEREAKQGGFKNRTAPGPPGAARVE